MYAKCILVLIGFTLAAVAIESLSSRDSIPPIRLAVPARQPDATGLDRMIIDLDLRKMPLKAVFHTLAAETHTNIAVNWKWGYWEMMPDVPISIHLHEVSLTTALRVIGDLVFGDAEDDWMLDYGIAPGGIIVAGSVPTGDRNYELAPVMMPIDITDLLRPENRERGADQPPRLPMLWLFRVPQRYPFYDFLRTAGPSFSAVVFGNQLVVYDTPERARQLRELIDAVRHPIDLTQPLPAPKSEPVRRLAHFRLQNVPVAEAFERWRQAVGVNAAVMLPRPRGYEGEKFPYDLRAPVTVDLHDVSAEHAVAAILDNCVGYLGSLSVYHDDGIVYVRPSGKRPAGLLRVFNVSQLVAHAERWYADGYSREIPENELVKALAAALDDYSDRYAYWRGRLAIFGTPEELEKKATRLRTLLLQKSPNDANPDPKSTGNP